MDAMRHHQQMGTDSLAIVRDPPRHTASQDSRRELHVQTVEQLTYVSAIARNKALLPTAAGE